MLNKFWEHPDLIFRGSLIIQKTKTYGKPQGNLWFAGLFVINKIILFIINTINRLDGVLNYPAKRGAVL